MKVSCSYKPVITLFLFPWHLLYALSFSISQNINNTSVHVCLLKISRIIKESYYITQGEK